ncbi:MAG: glycosyltransferase [Candidatus Gottesmanbacteria bacterium]|nr:glycosyltransferase [Candidatus Gottesmanbacteria bacterium]
MNTPLDKCLKQTSVLLVAHYATFAYQDLLYRYFVQNKSRLVTKINFPLPDLPILHHIEMTHAANGKQTLSNTVPSLWKPRAVAYFYQVFQYLWLVLRSPHVYDYVIAEDSLLAFTSIILKTLGKIRHIIFYSHGIDFTRFSSPWSNKLYQSIDRFSAKRSDYNWSLSQNMIPIRIRQGIPENRLFWVPSSLPIDLLSRKAFVSSHSLVFLGVINDKNGVGILPDIIVEIRKTIPDVHLDIMGEGDMKKNLQIRIKKLGLTKHIRMLGNVKFQQFKNTMTNYRLGLVTYKYSEVNLIPTSDSMKMRVYLAAGLPVVLTKGFIFSDEVTKNDLGYAVDYDVKAFAKPIIQILSDDGLSRRLRSNALAYSKTMDLTGIYNRTFTDIFSHRSSGK